MQLWSGLLSPFSAKIRIYLAERGISYEHAEIPWSRQHLWGPKPEEFLAVSPHGEVPALVDGDLAVFDSTLIWEYLEEAYPDRGLTPQGAAAKARCRMWEERADHTMAKHLTTLIREVYLPSQLSKEQSTALVTEAVAAVNAYYQALDQSLAAGGEYLCGAYSIADIATFVCLMFTQTLGAAVPEELQHLHAWLARMAARPVIAAEAERIVAGAAAA